MIPFKRALLVVAASVLPMAASAAVIASGVKIITGNYLFDFDTGTQSGPSTSADVLWEQYDTTTRALVAENGALIVNLGNVNFSGLTLESLQGLSYSTATISGGNVGNQLTYGDVFAIKTSDGNYAKAIVSFPFFDASQNNGLPIYFETFASPVPEAGSFALTLAGLGAMGWASRRRQGRTATV